MFYSFSFQSEPQKEMTCDLHLSYFSVVFETVCVFISGISNFSLLSLHVMVSYGDSFFN